MQQAGSGHELIGVKQAEHPRRGGCGQHQARPAGPEMHADLIVQGGAGFAAVGHQGTDLRIEVDTDGHQEDRHHLGRDSPGSMEQAGLIHTDLMGDPDAQDHRRDQRHLGNQHKADTQSGQHCRLGQNTSGNRPGDRQPAHGEQADQPGRRCGDRRKDQSVPSPERNRDNAQASRQRRAEDRAASDCTDPAISGQQRLTPSEQNAQCQAKSQPAKGRSVIRSTGDNLREFFPAKPHQKPTGNRRARHRDCQGAADPGDAERAVGCPGNLPDGAVRKASIRGLSANFLSCGQKTQQPCPLWSQEQRDHFGAYGDQHDRDGPRHRCYSEGAPRIHPETPRVSRNRISTGK